VGWFLGHWVSGCCLDDVVVLVDCLVFGSIKSVGFWWSCGLLFWYVLLVVGFRREGVMEGGREDIRHGKSGIARNVIEEEGAGK